MSETSRSLDALEAMLDALPAYLDGDSLFHAIVVPDPDGGQRRETLTLATLLMELDALAASGLAGDEAARLRAARERLASAREQDAFGAKLAKELRGAAAEWQAYAQDVQRDAEEAADAWRGESRGRGRAERLAEEAGALGLDVEEARASLAASDARIRPHASPCAFRGPPGAEARMPAERYWWAHATLD